MTYSLTWLPDVLRGAGLRVAETPGWTERGHGDVSTIVGVMCHHTAGPRSGNMPTLSVLINGRPDLSGPLCQLGLGRDGTYYVVAAGRAYHAGKGVWKGVATGNSSFIGIEAENCGTTDDPWPQVQLDAYVLGAAAILKKIGAAADMCCGHKEYALPLGRKDDPSFDMPAFRQRVQAQLDAGVAPATLIPARDGAGRVTLRRGSTGDLVEQMQVKVSVQADGVFGALTEAAVRAFQRRQGVVPDGVVGPVTWAVLDKV